MACQLGQVEGEALDEALQLHLASRCSRRRPHDRAEGVDHDDGGVDLSTSRTMRLQHLAQVLLQHLLAQVDEADVPVHLVRVEEAHLLLVAQHLEGRLAQHREVEGRSLGGGVGEHDLVGQGGLARAGRPGDQVEGVLGETAAQHLVQSRYSSREPLNVHLWSHAHSSNSFGPGPD